MRYADVRLLEMVSSGGIAKLYRARRHSDGRTVAVKFLRKKLWREQRAVASLFNEADLLQRLAHPHIVSLIGWGQSREGAPFLVLEWIEGVNLAQWAARERPSVSEIIRHVVPVAKALSAAHAAGVLHCDLKPANVLRRVDGHVLLGDFGFGRSILHPGTFPPRGGTAGFLAPEQVSDAFGEIGVCTDVYGLGALLYALLTGVPPMTGDSLAGVLANVLSSRPPRPPSEINREIPRILEDLCLRCLQKEPSMRYRAIADVEQSLRQ